MLSNKPSFEMNSLSKLRMIPFSELLQVKCGIGFFVENKPRICENKPDASTFKLNKNPWIEMSE